MSNLFKTHFEHFLKKYFTLQGSNPEITRYSLIREFKKSVDIQNGIILNRFPKKELRTVIKIECPIENDSKDDSIPSVDIIKAAKRLRNYMGVPESEVCHHCSKRDTCKFRDQIPEQKKSSISDMITFSYGLYNYQNNFHKENIDEPHKKDEELESKTKDSEKLDDSDEDDKGKGKDDDDNGKSIKQNISEDKFKNRYSFKVYTSALKTTDTLGAIVEDLKEEKGISSKMFINTYIDETNKLQQLLKENYQKVKEKERQEPETKANVNKASEKVKKTSNAVENEEENLNDSDLDEENEGKRRAKGHSKIPRKKDFDSKVEGDKESRAPRGQYHSRGPNHQGERSNKFQKKSFSPRKHEVNEEEAADSYQNNRGKYAKSHDHGNNRFKNMKKSFGDKKNNFRERDNNKRKH